MAKKIQEIGHFPRLIMWTRRWVTLLLTTHLDILKASSSHTTLPINWRSNARHLESLAHSVSMKRTERYFTVHVTRCLWHMPSSSDRLHALLLPYRIHRATMRSIGVVIQLVIWFSDHGFMDVVIPYNSSLHVSCGRCVCRRLLLEVNHLVWYLYKWHLGGCNENVNILPQLFPDYLGVLDLLATGELSYCGVGKNCLEAP